MLAPYHARLREELERHGGTVEKFIGDAVMAVFGAPVAHEDDPERAVRAALAIRSWVRRRAGGAAGAHRGQHRRDDREPRREAGRGRGDGRRRRGQHGRAPAVGGSRRRDPRRRPDVRGDRRTRSTTASRHPSARRAKRSPFRPGPCSRLARASASTSSRPRARRSSAATATCGSSWTTLARVRRERSPQLVTLVGVPGMGKSRLVYELFEGRSATRS